MKKLLVLALVLSVASLATAALDLNTVPGVSYTVAAGNVVTISVTKNIVGLMFNIQPDAGTLSAANITFGAFGTTNAGSWHEGLMDGVSASTGGDPITGTIMTIDFDNSATKAMLVNYYYADSNITWSTADGGKVVLTGYEINFAPTVPEPMTMGLLGLGSLFLARRKK